MRKNGHVALGILLAALLGQVCWKVFHQPEPTYKGKSLTAWLDCYTRAPQPMKEQVDEAVRNIGTNAIPTLLRRISAPYPYSPLKLRAIKIAAKLGILRNNYPAGDELNQQAHWGFLALGQAATNALPQLIAIYEKNIPGHSQHVVGSVLVAMGPAGQKAIPSLIRATTNANPRVRYEAVDVLGKFQTQPELVVPCLTNALYDPAKNVRESAIFALNNFETESASAVPALLDRIKNSDGIISETAINILAKIHPEPQLVIPTLIKALTDTNAFVSGTAACALRSYGEDAKSAVPALLDQLNNPDMQARAFSIQALGVIHGDPELVVPKLVEALSNPSHQVSQSTIRALGSYRKDANIVVPLLHQIAKRNPNMNITINQALEIIDPKGRITNTHSHGE